MENWLKVSILLCLFGLFKGMRPSEPYFTEFLMGEWRNFSEETVSANYEMIFPVSELFALYIRFL